MEKPQNYLSRLRRHPLLWNLALIAAIILLGILWIAKDFIYHTTGFDLLGAAKK